MEIFQKPDTTPQEESRNSNAAASPNAPVQGSLADRVLRKPRITEKSYGLGEKNQYVFEVSRDANKRSIAKAIADVYGVTVTRVNIVNLPSKAKAFGRNRVIGSQSATKKAIVTLAPGSSIEIFKTGA